MRALQVIVVFIGRVCLSIVFLVSALQKILGWQAAERSWVTLLTDWQNYVTFSPVLQHFFSLLLSYVPWILIILTGLELLGSLMLILGIKTRLSALFLLFCIVPTTLLFHHFWFLDGLRREMHLVLFLKNIAIIGGLLIVLTFGATIEKKKPFMLSIEDSPVDGA